MKIRRDIVLFIVLTAVLLIGAFFLGQTQPITEDETHMRSVYSTSPTGGSALAEWSRAIGFKTKPVEGGIFFIPNDLDVLFVIEPSINVSYTTPHARIVKQWVEDGHTLVFASDFLSWRASASTELCNALGITVVNTKDAFTETVKPSQPLLLHPSVEGATFTGRNTITATSAVAYLGDPMAGYLISKSMGKGRVFTFSSPYPLTNEGPKGEDNARLVLNILSTLPKGATIGFDEYHRQAPLPREITLFGELYGSPWGWALIITLVVFLVYFVLGGRRFAGILPGAISERRTLAEYVRSMSGLYKRAVGRAPVLNQFVEEFKRDIGRLYGIKPSLPNDEFAERLGAAGVKDSQKIAVVLSQAASSHHSEKSMVELAARIEQLKEELTRDRRRNQPPHR